MAVMIMFLIRHDCKTYAISVDT